MAMLVQPDVIHELRARQCRNGAGLAKRGYHTRADATRSLRSMQLAPGVKNLNAYRCPQCRMWHVGHKGTP